MSLFRVDNWPFWSTWKSGGDIFFHVPVTQPLNILQWFNLVLKITLSAHFVEGKWNDTAAKDVNILAL